MKRLVIIGSGSVAISIFFEMQKSNKYEVIGFIDEKKKKNEEIVNINNKSYKVLGNIKNFFNKLEMKNIWIVVGIGDSSIRKRTMEELISTNKELKFATIIFENVIFNNAIKIGEGTIVFSGVKIGHKVQIGKSCLLGFNTIIEHDTKIGNFVTTSPGVVIAGNVKIGNNNHIGIGSVIKNNINIENNTFIGSCSFVTNNCESNYLYIGTPAKKFKKRKKDDNFL